MTHNGKLYINGHRLDGDGPNFSSINPATGQTIWCGNEASGSQIESAVTAAHRAQSDWSRTEPDERANVLRRFGDLLAESAENLAVLICHETGKPLWEARGEVSAMMGKIKLSLQAFHERTSLRELPAAKGNAFVRYKPLGVVAVFGPYNFPGHLPNGHIVPALLAGNTLVFKPSEQTPKTAEATIDLWRASGIPDGVINLVQGGAEVGVHLLKQSIDGVFFTGSSKTGAHIHKEFGGRPEVMLALEMGGNNPLIVGKVEPAEDTIDCIIQSAFLTSGQRCTCARRLLLPEGPKGDTTLFELCKATRALSIGDPLESHFLGSLISAKQAQSMQQHQRFLASQGADVLLPLEQKDLNLGFCTPGIVDVTRLQSRPDEEVFGPLLQVSRYREFSAAIEEANNTRFGLSAGLLSRDQDEYDQFYRGIRAGIVNWNSPTTGASGSAPFGGVGASGNYRPSAYYAADYCSYPVASVEVC
ncbi:MAG: succinylglutamate-semialdehyde dehydrogenase [Halieaceae bacterium]|nr:succinylglutamate-semialdehyde dehydrogenase [Halieaceae bacterium]